MTDPNRYPFSDNGTDRVLDAVAESAMKRQAEKRQSEIERRKMIQKIEKKHNQKGEFIEEFCRPAEVIDYAYWLEGYIKNGGKITHHYDYNLPKDKLFVLQTGSAQAEIAKKGFLEIPKLTGASAFSLIIPELIEKEAVADNIRSHNNLYYMEGFSLNEDGFDFVPSYLDVEQEMLTLAGLPE